MTCGARDWTAGGGRQAGAWEENPVQNTVFGGCITENIQFEIQIVDDVALDLNSAVEAEG